MNNDPMNGGSFQAPPAPPTPPIIPIQPATESSGWAPAAEPTPVPISTPVPTPPPAPPIGSNPFETTPPPVPPVSGPMQPMGGQGMMESGRKSSLPLILILVVLIILGGLFFAAWMSWIPSFGLEKLWGGSTKTTPEVTTQTDQTSNTNVNDAKRKEDLANLKTALKKYYTVNQTYPIAATTEKTLDSVALKVLVPDYLASLPVDPLSPVNYYGYKSDGTTFELTAVLEDKTDPSGITVGQTFLYKITDISAETPATSSSSSATTPTNATTPSSTTTNTTQ